MCNDDNNYCHNFNVMSLTQFNQMFHFYILCKCQKTFGFLTFSWGIEMGHWTKMSQKPA